MQRIEFQSTYILHSRPYQETSLLLEVFTKDFGRFGVIAKGVRRQKVGTRGLIQPFVPLLMSCAGRGELLALKHYEMASTIPMIAGRRLSCAFYLNELLMRLLHRWDAHEDLFQVYSDTLIALAESPSEAMTLRLFEMALLRTIGYGLQLTEEVETRQPIIESEFYFFDHENGPSLMEKTVSNFSQLSSKEGVYSGKNLLSLAAGNLVDAEVQRDAKRLTRQALALRLGNKPLESRRLF
jgi:DNA repair protein RecO (recombination protein O)